MTSYRFGRRANNINTWTSLQIDRGLTLYIFIQNFAKTATHFFRYKQFINNISQFLEYIFFFFFLDLKTDLTSNSALSFKIISHVDFFSFLVPSLYTVSSSICNSNKILNPDEMYTIILLLLCWHAQFYWWLRLFT